MLCAGIFANKKERFKSACWDRCWQNVEHPEVANNIHINQQIIFARANLPTPSFLTDLRCAAFVDGTVCRTLAKKIMLIGTEDNAGAHEV